MLDIFADRDVKNISPDATSRGCSPLSTDLPQGNGNDVPDVDPLCLNYIPRKISSRTIKNFYPAASFSDVADDATKLPIYTNVPKSQFCSTEPGVYTPGGGFMPITSAASFREAATMIKQIYSHAATSWDSLTSDEILPDVSPSFPTLPQPTVTTALPQAQSSPSAHSERPAKTPSALSPTIQASEPASEPATSIHQSILDKIPRCHANPFSDVFPLFGAERSSQYASTAPSHPQNMDVVSVSPNEFSKLISGNVESKRLSGKPEDDSGLAFNQPGKSPVLISQRDVKCEIVLDQDFRGIVGREESFKQGLVRDLMRAAHGAQHLMTITALRAGSVIADVFIQGVSPDGKCPLDTVHLLQKQIGQPDSKLMQGAHTNCIISVRVKRPNECFDSSPEDVPKSTVGITCHEDHTLGFPRVFVTKVKPGSSAAQSGLIKPGDLLVVVGGEKFFVCGVFLICFALGLFLAIRTNCCFVPTCSRL